MVEQEVNLATRLRWLLELIVTELPDVEDHAEILDTLEALMTPQHTVLATVMRKTYTDLMIDYGYCPDCGVTLDFRKVLLNTHPYGDTTADEWESIPYCPNCGWGDVKANG